MIHPAIQAILLGVIVVAFGLNRLARALPDVEWLQAFRLPALQLTEEQKARRRRRAGLMAGVEIILAGLVLPLLYVASKVMMFNGPTTLGLIIVAACSLACIGIGLWLMIRSARA
jgi:hypothetical protein